MRTTDEAIRLLAARISRLEDELTIHRLIVRYGFAVDSGATDDMVELFTTDAVYEVDGAYMADGGRYVLRGHDDLRAMIDSDRHRALRPRCAHTIGPITVELCGDVAHAVGYSRVYWGPGDDAALHRLSANEWRLERSDGRWRIAYRRSVPIGTPLAQELLGRGIEALDSRGARKAQSS